MPLDVYPYSIFILSIIPSGVSFIFLSNAVPVNLPFSESLARNCVFTAIFSPCILLANTLGSIAYPDKGLINY